MNKKAIITKFHGPTNMRGARIAAWDCSGNRVYIPYPYELPHNDRHLAAAQALCAKLKLTGKLVGGAVKNGYAFVFVD